MQTLALLAALAMAPADTSPNSQAWLVSQQIQVTPGSETAVAVVIRHDPGWYSYWINPGDSGQATSIKWNAPAGFSVERGFWNPPQRVVSPDGVTFGYKGDAVHVARLVVPANAKPGSTINLRAQVRWLVCRETCLTAREDVVVSLRVADRALPSRTWGERFGQWIANEPRAWPPGFFALRSEGGDLVLTAEGLPAKSVEFFPAEPGTIAHDDPGRFRLVGDAFELRVKVSPYSNGTPQRLRGLMRITPPEGPDYFGTLDVPLS